MVAVPSAACIKYKSSTANTKSLLVRRPRIANSDYDTFVIVSDYACNSNESKLQLQTYTALYTFISYVLLIA